MSRKRKIDDELIEDLILNEEIIVEEEVCEPAPVVGVVNAAPGLNVRKTPNGKIVKILSNKTEVTISEELDGWGKIGEDQWVNLKYIIK